jgi:hypothetical protein
MKKLVQDFKQAPNLPPELLKIMRSF